MPPTTTMPALAVVAGGSDDCTDHKTISTTVGDGNFFRSIFDQESSNVKNENSTDEKTTIFV
uniref:Uncharacterized protein n=1 Tax=Romanomermis culicivorax TaxID=13658 RepID=A0A915L6U5_ROMCU